MECFFLGNIFIEEWLGVLINPGIPVTGNQLEVGWCFHLELGYLRGFHKWYPPNAWFIMEHPSLKRMI